MPNKILLKRTLVPGFVPTIAQVDLGEVFINLPDGRVFTRTAYDEIMDITKPLYNIDGGLLVGLVSTLNAAMLTEDGNYLFAENFTRLITE